MSLYNKEVMLSIIYLLNKKNIKYSHIFLFCVLVLMVNYISPSLLCIFLIDIYIYISLSQFNIGKIIYNSKESNLKMNITTEGLEKDEKDVKSILLNYISKFN